MVTIRRVKPADDFATIGELIYNTDRWVYPDLFGSMDVAKRAAQSIVLGKTLYNKDNIRLAEVDGKLAGYLTLLRETPAENTEEFRRAIAAATDVFPPKFDDVVTGYFDLIKPDPDKTEILSLSVLPVFRRMGVAQALIESLPSDVTYTLACVRDNAPARRLYEKCGFKLLYEYPGYTGVPCVELIKEKTA